MIAVQRHWIWLVTAVAALLIAAMPDIAGNEYALRFYTLMIIYMIIALGLNILVGYAGLISLGQAGLYAIGAYTGAILATRVGLNLLPCLLFGMTLAGFFGVLLAYPTVRVRGVYLAVVTIAFGIIVENVAIEWEWLTGSWVGISDVPQPTLLGLQLDFKAYFYLVGASALFIFLMSVNIMRSRYGRAMLASGQSEIATRSLGINVTMMRTLGFVISAVTAGAAGVFYVFLNKYISPDIFSFGDSIRFLLMVILGGAGTVLGPVVGAGILSYLPEFLQQFQEWQSFAYGALLAIVMFLLPRGIVGSLAGLFVRWEGPSTAESDVKKGKRLDEILALDPPVEGSLCLQAKDVTLRFGGLVALDNVNIDIQSCKIHALIGPNGAGKSTFLNAVSGTYSVSSGEIDFLGTNTTDRTSYELGRMGMGRTFQNTELFSEMTVLENVWIGFHNDYKTGLLSTVLRLPANRREEEHHRRAALELLDLVGLGDFAKAKAKDLPFGFQRKLEIARALATRPKLLLLDEPAAGLTKSEITELVDLIQTLAKSGITVLIIEHHVDLIMALSEHVTVLDYGQVIADGTVPQIQRNPKVIEAYFGSSDVLEHMPEARAKPRSHTRHKRRKSPVRGEA